MAETVVSSVLHELYQFVIEERSSVIGVERDFIDIKDELESIQALLKGADIKAADEEGGGANEGVKTWVKQLRETSFRIEDMIDEYNMYVGEAPKINHSGFIAKFQTLPNMIKSMKWRYQMASEIQDIKSSLVKIKERGQRYVVKSESGSSRSRGSKAARFGDPPMALYFNEEETQLVGFESQREEMVRCLVEGTDECSVVSIVGMGGLGKTTFAKLVFEDQRVKKHFDCRSFITVSQSYNMRGLLIEMINKFCKDSNEPIPKGLQMSDGHKLITHVGQYLDSKRYLVLFDDVWKVNFSDEIQHALIGSNTGSRIIVTTRRMHVAEYFKKSFPVHIHKLQPLSPEKASELFCNKVFRGKCPKELGDMSHELVQICGGLPLAIVAIAGLLSTKPKTVLEWRQVNRNIRMELDRNVHMTHLRKILSLSYDDLPYHLKSCLLYFGIYPEHYTIKRKRLTRQWMAEGFVRCEESRNLEEVAEEYLTELIHRSLVQVSKVSFDGKVKSCRVHNLLREVIIRKMQDLSFCHLMHEDDEQETVGITRRFSITSISNNVLRSKSNSGIRAIFVFDKGELPKGFMDELCTKFELLKVLDFENSLLSSIPDDLGNLFHLRYLNLNSTKVKVLPRSIGKLVNLETLDLRQTKVHELPREINKLTKLRLLLAYYRKYGLYSIFNFTTGVQMQEGIGCLKSLQKLYFLEADHGGVDLIQELKKLIQLRKFGIRGVRREYGNALCATIQEMKQLESLNITVIAEGETLDLDFVAVPPPNLRVLNLKGRLTKLPYWIPNLNYLVKLRLGLSNFEHDPLEALKNLPNLLGLNLWDDAFSGESLHFQVGGFPKLKELDLTRLNRLSSISIDEEALLGLEHFRFKNNPQLKVLPRDLQNLKNLQFLGFADMPAELVDSIEIGGPCHWVINHIPLVQICENVGSKFHDYKLHRIPTQFNV
ncbi:NBS-containing resistance-like protein [Trifolium pratense]|uniref:NBS-containing resistance-like protein n=1 Tax=Trifolium pratense TaxID=57577 RepID=A0A2K3NAL9_TRIPR|nr:NBS-containing resistance-like protein [Trifolium pratense]